MSEETITPEKTVTPDELPVGMPEIEAELRVSILQQSKEMLVVLTQAIGMPGAETRALHLISKTAEVYQQLLVVLGTKGGERRLLKSIGQYQSNISADVDDDDSEIDAAEIQPGGETFGGQALGQILALAKSHLSPSQPVVQTSGFDIESLTRALAQARTAELPASVINAIEQRLVAGLAAGIGDADAGANAVAL